MIKGVILLIIVLFGSNKRIFAQGKNYNWLLGYNVLLDPNTTATKAQLHFDSTSMLLIPQFRKMAFSETQANISDENGNLLIATNGCWIADITGDTMMNGAGLNPGPIASAWCTNHSGIPFPNADLILPFSGITDKYILFHQTGNTNVNASTELFYTIINMSNNGGLGGVDSLQKNIITIQDTIELGISACKHANGRDWWIIALKESSDLIYTILVTPTGISSITSQHLGVPYSYGVAIQPTFSPDGKKFIYSFGDTLPISGYTRDVRLFDFDRCSGLFSNPLVYDISDSMPGFGLAFSPDSKYVYACSTFHVFQISTDSLNATIDTVATYDGYASPNPPFYTVFWTMYLAANGKIYISTGNGTLDLHYINYPDSAGITCDVQQHALHLPCYSVGASVNHPNYYLGCDTSLGCPCLNNVGINELTKHDFKFSISPNPTNGNVRIMYLLPQNKTGVFEVYDINGKKVFSYGLPQWSTLQNFNLSFLQGGIYQCSIVSDGYRVSKKVVVIR